MPPPENICLALALNDKHATLLPKARLLWPKLSRHFSQIVVHYTDITHSDWESFLSSNHIHTARSPQNWDRIGLHRRKSLALALAESNCDFIFYSDPDHILRWLEYEPEELLKVLSSQPVADCLVMGRTTSNFLSSPERLKQTEAAVNEIYYLQTGKRWDMLMAIRLLSRTAAEHLVKHNQENTLGNDLAWPMMLAAAGFSLDYLESQGIQYQTDEAYADGANDKLDQDVQAWSLRVYAAHQQIEAIKPYLL